MPISFAYTNSSATKEVWNGVFYSPDHDPALNRDPVFIANLSETNSEDRISLNNVGTNLLLDITATLIYDNTEGLPVLSAVSISNFQSDGTSNRIRSNKDSVLLNYSCEDITPDNFNNFKWEESDDGSTMEHEFTHTIRARYKGKNSDNLVISGKITNQLPTCKLKVLVNDDDIKIGSKVNIDLGTDSFKIRLAQIEDEQPHYLELNILGGEGVNLDELKKLVMFRQTYGEGQTQTIDSLDIVGFSLEATTSGTGESFTLDLTYTLDSDPNVVVPRVNNIGLMLTDPIDLQRPAETDIDHMYNFIPNIVTVMTDASNPVVNLTPTDGFIVMGDIRYPGFDPTVGFLERQPSDNNPIDIPMTIFLPDGASRICITPSIELNGDPHDWNVWSDPQKEFGIIYNDGDQHQFDEYYDIVNKGMDSIDIVFRIHQKEYWNGDFNLYLTIDSYDEKDSNQGVADYVFPYVISIKPKDSKILTRQGGGGAVPF